MFEKLRNKIAEVRETTVAAVFADDQTAEERYAICLACEKFHKTTKVCTICHCYMPGKTKLAQVSCPIKKWVAKHNLGQNI
jgi:hypothetical protein